MIEHGIVCAYGVRRALAHLPAGGPGRTLILPGQTLSSAALTICTRRSTMRIMNYRPDEIKRLALSVEPHLPARQLRLLGDGQSDVIPCERRQTLIRIVFRDDYMWLTYH